MTLYSVKSGSGDYSGYYENTLNTFFSKEEAEAYRSEKEEEYNSSFFPELVANVHCEHKRLYDLSQAVLLLLHLHKEAGLETMGDMLNSIQRRYNSTYVSLPYTWKGSSRGYSNESWKDLFYNRLWHGSARRGYETTIDEQIEYWTEFQSNCWDYAIQNTSAYYNKYDMESFWVETVSTD